MIQPDILLQDKNYSFFPFLLNTICLQFYFFFSDYLTISVKLKLIVGGELPNLPVYCHFSVFVDNASQQIREMAGSFGVLIFSSSGHTEQVLIVFLVSYQYGKWNLPRVLLLAISLPVSFSTSS